MLGGVTRVGWIASRPVKKNSNGFDWQLPSAHCCGDMDNSACTSEDVRPSTPWGGRHHMREDLESIALQLLTDVEATPPISAFTLAHWCGLTVATTNCQGRRGFALYFDGLLSEHAREWQVALGIAHWRLARIGAPTVDADVEYLGRALLLPLEPFVRDVRSTRSVRVLQQRHRYVNRLKIQERIHDVYEEVMRLRLVGT